MASSGVSATNFVTTLRVATHRHGYQVLSLGIIPYVVKGALHNALTIMSFDYANQRTDRAATVGEKAGYAALGAVVAQLIEMPLDNLQKFMSV